MNRTRIALGALVLSSAFLLPGCLITSGNSTEEYGTRITGQTLSQIEPGVTTEAWLKATLGDPHACTPVEDDPGTKIYRYDHTVEKSSGGTVFLLFAGASSSEKTTSMYFETSEGLVTRYWREP
jgi:hypothetical protein